MIATYRPIRSSGADVTEEMVGRLAERLEDCNSRASAMAVSAAHTKLVASGEAIAFHCPEL